MKFKVQNLDYPDLDYPDYSIIRTIRLSGHFSLVPILSWILISCEQENKKPKKAQ